MQPITKAYLSDVPSMAGLWCQWKTHPWQTGCWLGTGKFQIPTGTVRSTST